MILPTLQQIDLAKEVVKAGHAKRPVSMAFISALLDNWSEHLAKGTPEQAANIIECTRDRLYTIAETEVAYENFPPALEIVTKAKICIVVDTSDWSEEDFIKGWRLQTISEEAYSWLFRK